MSKPREELVEAVQSVVQEILADDSDWVLRAQAGHLLETGKFVERDRLIALEIAGVISNRFVIA